MEFALDQTTMPMPVMQGGTLTLSYQPRPIFTEWGTLKPQSSLNLKDWTDVPAGQITAQPDGSVSVQLTTPGHTFLRLEATGP